MTQGFTLSADSIRQLKKVVREWYAVWKNEQTPVPYYGQVRDTRRWAILDADLLAAHNMFFGNYCIWVVFFQRIA